MTIKPRSSDAQEGDENRSDIKSRLIVKNITFRHIHCVSENDNFPPTTNDNFNSSCPFPVIYDTNITERICHRKMIYFPTLLVQCNVLWETLGTCKSKSQQ